MLSRTGQIVDFREKEADSPSNLNNASIYIIEAGFLKELDALRTEARLDVPEPMYDFGKHVFPAMLGKLPYLKLSRECLLWGVQYDGPWFDVGQKRDYLRVNQQLLDGSLALNLPFEQLPWGYLGTEVAIDFPQVTIIPPVVIGNQCVVEPGATLGPYAVIGDGWIIARDARVSNSVLWERYPMTAHGGRCPPLSGGSWTGMRCARASRWKTASSPAAQSTATSAPAPSKCSTTAGSRSSRSITSPTGRGRNESAAPSSR